MILVSGPFTLMRKHGKLMQNDVTYACDYIECEEKELSDDEFNEVTVTLQPGGDKPPVVRQTQLCREHFDQFNEVASDDFFPEE